MTQDVYTKVAHGRHFIIVSINIWISIVRLLFSPDFMTHGTFLLVQFSPLISQQVLTTANLGQVLHPHASASVGVGISRLSIPLDSSGRVLLSQDSKTLLLSSVDEQCCTGQQPNACDYTNNNSCNGAARKTRASRSRILGRVRCGSGSRGGGSLLVGVWQCCVEAGDLVFEVGELDIGNISTGIKCLVLGLVKAGDVLDLQRGV